ncbi:MAG: acetyl-CoA hydrolase/transferase C-terminal domain-containing protein [Rhodospirillaceae bacterium]
MIFHDPEAIVDDILRTVGKRIVLGLPLGLGKANHIANALYARAAKDSSISLRIFTALTLEPPQAHSELERRFVGPLSERLFAGYPPLLYAKSRRDGTTPANIQVHEFFMLAGRWLSNPAAQQDYIAANYTHAARVLIDMGVNVIGQLVARSGDRYSLSCNPDLTLDLLRMRTAPIKLVGQVNTELPFMYGDGDLPADAFSHILDSPATDFPLFAPPKEPVDLGAYAMALHVAGLVPDGGTLQIGIGQEADAIGHCLILRHRHAADYRAVLARLSPGFKPDDAPFTEGLHGLSEMFVDTFLELIDAGILKREVNGALLHGAFFLGPRNFYRRLREMAAADRARLRMTAVSFTNELYGDETAKRPSRVKARFINNAMMATLLGAAISDGLEDGKVVSGVGGQYNFVAQAFALPDARSVIVVPATRTSRGRTLSNIRWAYGHETIPRHLRDTIVSEYGVADLRGRSDREVVAAMLAIADSRFQPKLLEQAKAAGKIEPSFTIPEAHCNNTPKRVAAALEPLAARGLLPSYPFGTDFTAAEQRLIPALAALNEAAVSPVRLARFVLKNWPRGASDGECLTRMGLDAPSSLKEWAYRFLVRAALMPRGPHV